MGKVIFVGGGIYDSSYLTIQGKEAIKKADCILYDELLHPSILTYNNKEKIYVGKKCGMHSMKQEEINQLLLQKAKQHNTVVRLKGGDSFIFGRGGEEAMYLLKHQIEYDFVPGISSVIAVAELANIPLTYRSIAYGFHVYTACLKNHTFHIDTDLIKNEKITLVFVMGLAKIQEIVFALKEAKRSPSTPIAIITKGGSPFQKIFYTTLSNALDDCRNRSFESPGIIIIGEVVAISKQLRKNRNQKLLLGKQFHVCTQSDTENVLIRALKNEGAYVENLQVGEIEYTTSTLNKLDLKSIEGVIFTSKHGIQGFFDYCKKEKVDIRKLYPLKFVVIGEKTKAYLEEFGIFADYVGNGDIDYLKEGLQTFSYHNFIHVCGKDAQKILISDFIIPQHIVYQNKYKEINIENNKVDAICFGCASSVKRYPFSSQDTPCFSIGKKTTEALKQAGMTTIYQADHTSYEELFSKIMEVFYNVSR